MKDENSGKYLKLQQGTNKIRVLTETVAGYEFFGLGENGKQRPFRRMYEEGSFSSREMDERGASFESKQKLFFACLIYNYDLEKYQIWECTQASIQDRLREIRKDPDYGAIQNYDLKITKTGTGKETRYGVNQSPPKAIDKKILQNAPTVDLYKLFTSEDHFNLSI